MSRRRSSGSGNRFVQASRIVGSQGAATTATGMLIVLFLCSVIFIFGISQQEKQIEKNYQKIFAEAGFSHPRSIDEAALWMEVAEDPAYTNGPVLFTYRGGEAVPQVRSSEYGWELVAQTECSKDTAKVSIEYYSNRQIIETIEIPVTKSDTGSWFGRIETKSTIFDAYCDVYNDNIYFTIRLKAK